MRVQAVLDQNIISGFILLETPAELTVDLVHKYAQGPLTKTISLHQFSVQGRQGLNDFVVLNPFYLGNLCLIINGSEYEVIDGTLSEVSGQNPANDAIQVTRDIPMVHAMVAAPEIQRQSQDFTNLMCHSELVRIAGPQDLRCGDLVGGADGFVFAGTSDGTVTVTTGVIDISSLTKFTAYLKSNTEPVSARLILINVRGLERAVDLTTSYMVGEYFCLSQLLTGSTRNARFEMDFEPSGGYLSLNVSDFGIVMVPQFTVPAPAERSMTTLRLQTYHSNLLGFEFLRTPHFGLQNLLDLTSEGNGVRIQLSNRRIRVTKIASGQLAAVVESPPVGRQFAVFLSREMLSIYEGETAIKTVSGDFSAPIMNDEILIGSTLSDPEFDLNSEILKFSLLDHDIFR